MLYSQQDAEKAAEYVIYLRKSRQDIEAEKRGEMETLARHEKILNDVATEQGLNVVKVYKELVSGETIQDRPQMQQLMKEVYAGKYTGVLVVAADRLSRGDLENMGYILNGLKFSSTLLVTPGMTYDVAHNKYHEQMLEMQLFNSKQEYRAITGRMQEGKLLSVREGNYMGSLPPRGYDIDKPDRYTRTLKPNQDAELIKRIFDMFVNQNLTAGKIACILTAEGVPTKTDCTEWNRNVVRWLLKNPAYIGKIRWQSRKVEKEMNSEGEIKKRRRNKEKYILIDGKHPAIIDEETYYTALSKMKDTVPAKHETAFLNAFAGVLVCSKCGRALTYTVPHESKPPRLKHCTSSVCSMKSAVYTEILELVCQALKEYIADFEFKLDNADKMEMAKKHSAEMVRLEKEFEKAKEKRRRLFDDYEEGIYTAEEFRERKTIWAERISRMAENLEELQRTKPQEIDYQEKIGTFTKVLEALQNDEVSAKEKNILLKSIIEKIKYFREGNSRSPLAGGKITLDIILKE